MKHKIISREKDGDVQSIIWIIVQIKTRPRRNLTRNARRHRKQLISLKIRIGLHWMKTWPLALRSSFSSLTKNELLSQTLFFHILIFANTTRHIQIYLCKKITPLKVDTIISTITTSMVFLPNSFDCSLKRKILSISLILIFRNIQLNAKEKVSLWMTIIDSRVVSEEFVYLVFCKIAYRFGIRAGEVLGWTPYVVFKDKIIAKQQ